MTTLTLKMLFLMFKCNFLYLSLCSLSLLLFLATAEKSLALLPPVQDFVLPSVDLQEIHVGCWSQVERSQLMLVDFTSTDWKTNLMKFIQFNNTVAAEIIKLTISCWFGYIHENKINKKKKHFLYKSAVLAAK